MDSNQINFSDDADSENTMKFLPFDFPDSFSTLEDVVSAINSFAASQGYALIKKKIKKKKIQKKNFARRSFDVTKARFINLKVLAKEILPVACANARSKLSPP